MGPPIAGAFGVFNFNEECNFLVDPDEPQFRPFIPFGYTPTDICLTEKKSATNSFRSVYYECTGIVGRELNKDEDYEITRTIYENNNGLCIGEPVDVSVIDTIDTPFIYCGAPADKQCDLFMIKTSATAWNDTDVPEIPDCAAEGAYEEYDNYVTVAQFLNGCEEYTMGYYECQPDGETGVIRYQYGPGDSSSCANNDIENAIATDIFAEECGFMKIESCGIVKQGVVQSPNPTMSPTDSPTMSPTDKPTNKPTDKPTGTPTNNPTDNPTSSPTGSATDSPTDSPTASPTDSSSSLFSTINQISVIMISMIAFLFSN